MNFIGNLIWLFFGGVAGMGCRRAKSRKPATAIERYQNIINRYFVISWAKKAKNKPGRFRRFSGPLVVLFPQIADGSHLISKFEVL